jgi:hypothetical protein
MADPTGSDPKLPTGSNRCRCGACHRYFSSVASFDAHRVGDGDARRCLPEPEMLARGMVVNDKGYWVTEAWDGRVASAYDREMA